MTRASVPPNAVLESLQASIVEAVAVLARLAKSPQPAPGWVAVDAYVTAWTRREAAERCRMGQIPGARRVGKRWLARPADIDRAIAELADDGAARRALRDAPEDEEPSSAPKRTTATASDDNLSRLAQHRPARTRSKPANDSASSSRRRRAS